MRKLGSKDENEKVPLGNHPRLQPVVENIVLYRVLCVCVFHHILSMAGDKVPGKDSWCCFRVRSMYTQIYELSQCPISFQDVRFGGGLPCKNTGEITRSVRP